MRGLNIFPARLPREGIANSEYEASKFFKYLRHWNDNTILTSDHCLIQVVKVVGFSFETADDEDLDIKKALRNTLFKGMNAPNIGLYFHIIRKKQQSYPEGYVNIDMPKGFPSFLDQAWVHRFEGKEEYVNQLYVSIILNSQTIDSVFHAILNKFGGEKNTGLKTLQDAYDQLEEATGRVVNTLQEYGPSVLGIERTKTACYSEILEFFAMIPNLLQSGRVMYTPDDLSRYVSNSRLYFGSKSIESKNLDGSSRFAGIVSIKEYGQKTWPGILDTFLQSPFEFIITQSYRFANRQTAIAKMQLQQNRMVQSGDKAVSQIVEINEALDQSMSGVIGFGQHHLTVMCISRDLKRLENYLSIASVELTNTGGIGVRERVNMEPAFWGQMPGNFDYIVRSSTVNTLNLASFCSFHNYPLGKAKNNYWGDAVTVLETTSGTPYYFNFHLRDVGHTTIIGPTGAGKTVLMTFLCAQAQKFRCRLFFFDKDHGAEIFLRALNGNYTAIDPGQPCGFNPLKLPDTSENRSFLLDWMKSLVSVNGEVVTAEEVSLLAKAIIGNYNLDPKDRKLSNIAPFLGLEGPGSLAGRLAMWHSEGSHSTVFDNDEDTIDFTKAVVFGFEMGELLKDKVSLSPVLLYLFQRINMSLDGTPSMLVLDEAWALIDNPVFAPKLKDWLKVLRKLNAFVVFATQSVEDASKSTISDTLIQQTATQIFLPNLRATEAYRTVFMLSEREYALIKTTDPGSRYFLIKQGHDAVIARVDLSGMGDIVSILSGRAETVVILDEVRKQYGEDPAIWLPKFGARVREMSDKG